MALDGRRYQRLQLALLSAFPTPQAMRELLLFQLDVSLDAISGGSNYSEIVFGVISWAVSRNKLRDLIGAARKDNPGNPDLIAIAAELDQAKPPTDDLSDLVPLLRWADASGQLGQLIAIACGPDGATVDIRDFVTRTLAAATNRANVSNTGLLELAANQPTDMADSHLEALIVKRAAAAGTTPGPAAVAPPSAADKAALDDLASRFEGLRKSMPSSAQRTRLQEDIASQMRMLAPRLQANMAELASSDRLGERLAAVTLLQEEPRREYLGWLAERFQPSEPPFTGYHAALALRNAARSRPEDRDAVRDAIETGLRLIQDSHPQTYRGLDRYMVLESALAAADPPTSGPDA
jgi:hypothetical protein